MTDLHLDLSRLDPAACLRHELALMSDDELRDRLVANAMAIGFYAGLVIGLIATLTAVALTAWMAAP